MKKVAKTFGILFALSTLFAACGDAPKTPGVPDDTLPPDDEVPVTETTTGTLSLQVDWGGYQTLTESTGWQVGSAFVLDQATLRLASATLALTDGTDCSVITVGNCADGALDLDLNEALGSGTDATPASLTLDLPTGEYESVALAFATPATDLDPAQFSLELYGTYGTDTTWPASITLNLDTTIDFAPATPIEIKADSTTELDLVVDLEVVLADLDLDLDACIAAATTAPTELVLDGSDDSSCTEAEDTLLENLEDALE